MSVAHKFIVRRISMDIIPELKDNQLKFVHVAKSHMKTKKYPSAIQPLLSTKNKYSDMRNSN